MQWEAAGRADPSVRLSNPRRAHDIADLGLLHEFRQPRAIAAMTFREGLLALHQPGAALALIHPFGKGDRGAVVWHDADLLKSNPTTRAYSPQKPPGSRFWIFSSPAGALCVDGWSLPGWSISPVRRRAIVDCAGPEHSGQSNPTRLAVAPCYLGADRLGLLLRRPDGVYLWAVVDAAAQEPLNAFEQLPELGDLSGVPCQVEVTSCAIALATPLGHWVWPLADAIESRVDGLKRTWPLNGEKNRLVLNSEIRAPEERSWPRQILYQSPGNSGMSDNMRWYYQEDGPPSVGKWYRVRLDPFLAEQPQPIGPDGKGVLPLGLHQPRDAAQGNTELLFLRDNSLLRQPTGGSSLGQVQGLLQSGNQLSGLSYRDPLLTCVVGVHSGQRSHPDLSVEVLSVEQPQVRATVPNLRLYADPLTWSNWLFTYEDAGGSYLVRRRWLGADEE